MKIGIILRKVKRKDGIQQEALMLARELKKRKHDITIYTFEFEKEEADPQLIEGMRIIALSQEKRAPQRKIFGILSRPSYIIRWRRRNEEARSLAYLIDRDTELLNPHSINTYPVSAYFKKEIKNIPCVWVVSTIPLAARAFVASKEIYGKVGRSFLKRFFYRFMDQIEIRKFMRPHRIVALAEENRKQVQKWIGRDADVVYVGTDINRFQFAPHPPPQEKKINLLLTGKLFEYRRFEDAIEAAAMLTGKGYDMKVNIIGAYDQRPEYHKKLQDVVKERDLFGRVFFLGFVPDGDIPRLYREADIAVSPVIMQEAGIGLTVIEAMASGLPLVISRGAAACEVLTDGSNALFVGEKSPADIAAAIERLAGNPDLYTALSKNGRRFVEERLTWSAYASGLEKIFREEVARINVR